MKKLHIALLVAFFVAPAISLASIDTNLKYGSRGVAVTELQDFLIEKGFLTGQASGNFFSLTRKAVVAYQASVGLPATGYVGPMTRTKINDDLSSANASSVSAEITETGTTTAHTNTSNTAILTQTNTTTPSLVSGCSSTLGFSTITGKRCSDTTTTATSATNKTVTLSTGAVVEIDALGNITRTITPAPIMQSTPSNVSNTVTSTEIQISSINVTPSFTSAKIEWQTDKPTDSKVFISGGSLSSKIYNSESGLSTRHIINASGLSSITTYSYEIESISGNQVAKKSGSLTTKSPPIDFTSSIEGNGVDTKLYITSNQRITPDNIKIIKGEWSTGLWGERFGKGWDCDDSRQACVKYENSVNESFSQLQFCETCGGLNKPFVYRFALSSPLENFVDTYSNGSKSLYYRVQLIGLDGDLKQDTRSICNIFHSEMTPEDFLRQNARTLDSIQDKCL